MSVASHHHGLLDACVSNAFHELLDCHSSNSAHESADDVVQVARGIEMAVKTAILRCYYGWNDAHRDPVLRLPRELVLECFEALDFNGRKAVTHVSRAWRSLALSDFRLWNSVSLPSNRPAVALDMLVAFLHRSDPKPFTLSSMNQGGDRWSDALLEVIINNFHRIESLKIAHRPQTHLLRLFSQPAPILRTFSYSGLLDLSMLRGGEMAQCLESIDASLFTATEPCRPVATVRSFRFHLRTHAAPPAFLFEVFPALTSLELLGVTQQSLNNFGSLAPSITCLRLRASRIHRRFGMDYSPIIPTLAGLNLSSLFLGSASTVSGLVQLFVEKTQGGRRIDIPWRGDVYMESEADDIRFTIDTSYQSLSLDNEPGILAPLRAFSALSLTLELLVAIVDSLPEGDRTLSNVRSLTVILDWMDKLKYLPAVYERSAGPVDAPQLRSLSFTTMFVGYHEHDEQLDEFGRWLGTQLPGVVPLILSYPKANVSFITMEAEDTALLMRCGTDNLRRLAGGLAVSQLKFLNTRTREVTELPLQDHAAVLVDQTT